MIEIFVFTIRIAIGLDQGGMTLILTEQDYVISFNRVEWLTCFMADYDFASNSILIS